MRSADWDALDDVTAQAAYCAGSVRATFSLAPLARLGRSVEDGGMQNYRSGPRDSADLARAYAARRWSCRRKGHPHRAAILAHVTTAGPTTSVRRGGLRCNRVRRGDAGD